MNTPLKDSTSIIYLRNLYKERFKHKDEICEKDIVYFLRDSISDVYYPIQPYDKKRVAKSFYETEILNLVKAKEWDWHYVDIDNCNILTYSIFNKADTVSDYLIEKKYDLSVYKKDVSDALCASIRMNNLDYFKKIVDNPILNLDYLVDLNIKSYMSKTANPSGLGKYNEYLSTLEQIHCPEIIEKTVTGIIKEKHNFDSFLELQSFEPSIFIAITEKVLNEKFKSLGEKKTSHAMTSFAKFKLFYELQNNLESKPIKISKKI